jgi:3-deoxy-manno-octulosonate cytidylyltransferase (CMP-KDO synthetase)
MKVAAVIPARKGSSRFYNKPMAKILDKEMIGWVIEGVQTSKKISDVIVATDSEEIFKVAEKFQAKAVMTDSSLPSGTDRIFAAVKNLNFDIILNVQGDEPLVNSSWLDPLIDSFTDTAVAVSTLSNVLTLEDLNSANAVKVLVNAKGEAIYFSRFPIPFSRVTDFNHLNLDTNKSCFKHVGIYGYRSSFLSKFCTTKPCDMELAESLEQLRALYLGEKIKVHTIRDISCGVDVEEDIEKVTQLLLKRGNLYEKK